jgi:hypothetical protein
MRYVVSPMTNLHAALSRLNLIGLVLHTAEGGWQAAIETSRGSWSDGPVCPDADAAIAAVLALAEPPAPPVSMLPPPPY